jgi:hypothetical protein
MQLRPAVQQQLPLHLSTPMQRNQS